MNETLKRTISGAVYIALLVTSILFSTESFIILFGIFLVIATYEFCNLVKINKYFAIMFVSLFYAAVSLISFYRIETQNYISKILKENILITVNTDNLFSVLLVITLLVS